VAAGSIGAIKSLEHLRGVVSHIGGIVLPLPISIANVQSVFDRDGRPLDSTTEKMVRQVATNLTQAQTAYSATLAAAAKILPTSLLDYLK